MKKLNEHIDIIQSMKIQKFLTMKMKRFKSGCYIKKRQNSSNIEKENIELDISDTEDPIPPVIYLL